MIIVSQNKKHYINFDNCVGIYAAADGCVYCAGNFGNANANEVPLARNKPSYKAEIILERIAKAYEKGVKVFYIDNIDFDDYGEYE